ncbi:MAG: hypothetical protein KIS78_07865 [Labilithrix sp.]|nr:hypothetical protein [Labilithrix sp.]
MSEPNDPRTSPTPGFKEDELGVPSFAGKAVGDSWHHGYHDPFEQKLEALKHAAGRVDVGPFVDVHDDLEVCRSIAVSVFGRAWREHVMDVYDRVQRLRQAKERPSDE